MCVVADRGMISAETIAELERRGIDSILGARERSDAEVRRVVLADSKSLTPLVIPRARGAETAIEAKEVVVGDWGPQCKPRRYVVCFNPEQAQRDAAARAAILDSLRMKLRQGDKGLVGNAGYRRFLATPREGHFEIDADRIAEDARFDGLYVLRTTARCPRSRSPSRIVNCGEWRRSSKPRNRFWRRGRFIINPTPPLPAICFVRSSLCSCARNSMSDWRLPT